MEKLMIKIQKKKKKVSNHRNPKLFKGTWRWWSNKTKNVDDKCNKFYELSHSYLKNGTISTTHNLDLKSMSWVSLTSKYLVTWENAKN